MGLLGYGSITLTDLTEAMPISLNLSSSLATNIQVKEGTNYVPDFTTEGVVITPSVFLGGDKIEASKYVGKISYSIDGIIAEPNEKDNDGNLVCYKIMNNLTKNTSIGANISNFTSDEGITYTAIYALNPITLMLLEKDGGFSAFIESARDFFDEKNSGAITLTARLYSGAQEQSENISYKWMDSQGEEKGNEKTLSVSRDEVGSIETFICEIENQYGTKFRVSKNIYDRTDAYHSSIVSNGSTILTPQNTTLTLTNQVWYQTEIINSEDRGDFVYDWYCVGEGLDFKPEDHGKEKTFSIDLSRAREDGSLIFPKNNFVVYCETAIHNKTISIASLSIQYSPINYQVSIEPIVIFAPATNTGNYAEENIFNRTIRFRLLDDNKQPLSFNSETDVSPSLADFIPFTSSTIVSRTEGKWDFNINLQYDKTKDTEDNFLNTPLSKTFTLNYKYLGASFDASFELIKSVQGEDGVVGASGYTLSLTNEFWMLAGGESKANEGQTTEIGVEVFEGSSELTINKIKIEANGTSYNFDDTGKMIVNNIEITKNADYKKLTLTTKNGITNGGTLSIFVSFTNLNGETITMVKAFRYEVNYKGDSYELLCSPTSLIYSVATKSFNEASINLSPVRYIGGVGDATMMSSYLLTAQIDNGAEENLSTLSFTNFSKNDASITFRLYKEAVKDTSKLVDIKTIPIVISQEGLIIGGENLIPWTKKMPQETNKWVDAGQGEVEIGDSYSFATARFYELSSLYANASPLFSFESPSIPVVGYSNTQLTFSASLYSEDWSLIGKTEGTEPEGEPYFSFELVFDNGVDEPEAFTLIKINNAIDFTGVYDGGATLPAQRWFRMYQTITLPDYIDENYISMKVVSHLTFCGDVSFKQLKLEKGNTPTDWSAAEGDLSYDDIVGTNLSQISTLRIQVKANDPYIFINNSLEENTTYTFSVMNTAVENIEGDVFLWQVVKMDEGEENTFTVVETYQFSNRSSQTQVQTFTTLADEAQYGLIIYAKGDTEIGQESSILTLSYVKLEKGSEATSFVASEDYLSTIYNELNENNNQLIQEITIIKADGEEIQTQLDGTQQSINELQQNFASSSTTLNEMQTNLTMVNNTLTAVAGEDSYLQQIQKRITFSTEDTATSPYIQIATKSGDGKGFSTKITDSQIGFYQDGNEEPVAYLSGNSLQVNYARFNRSFNIGNLIVSITDSGVGFNW